MEPAIFIFIARIKPKGVLLAAFQEEDNKGTTAVSLTKDLIQVAGKNLSHHITILAPRGESTQQQHSSTCASTHRSGGIDGKVLRGADELTEPARTSQTSHVARCFMKWLTWRPKGG
ncbi:hypothetical protein Ancab_036242 [Ancistrocladus abbreviatus]